MFGAAGGGALGGVAGVLVGGGVVTIVAAGAPLIVTASIVGASAFVFSSLGSGFGERAFRSVAKSARNRILTASRIPRFYF